MSRVHLTRPIFTEDLEHVLSHTRGMWEQARGQSIFITGGTGFFGSWLLESFAYANDRLELGASAVVLTRDPASFAGKMPHLATRTDIRTWRGDIRDFDFPIGKFPLIIHAATDSDTGSVRNDAQDVFDVIVQGTRRVLTFAGSVGAEKLLLLSSGAVYGRQSSDLKPIVEEYTGAPDPLSVTSAYGEGKRAAELLCALAGVNQHLEVKIARCFAFIGPNMPLSGSFAAGNFIRDVLNHSPIRVLNGAPSRSYMYMSDLAIWLWTILFNGAPGRAYNVGSDVPISIADLARRIAVVAGVDMKLDEGGVPGVQRSGSYYVPSTHRATFELGLRQYVGLDQAIKNTLHWYRLINEGI